LSAATLTGLAKGSHPGRSWRRLLLRVARDRVVGVDGRVPLRMCWKPCCGIVVVRRVVDSWSVVLYRSFVARGSNGWVVIVCLYGWAVVPGAVKSVRACNWVRQWVGWRKTREGRSARKRRRSKRRGGRISYQQRASEAETKRQMQETDRQAGCATGQP
jgi:hypothetical protein